MAGMRRTLAVTVMILAAAVAIGGCRKKEPTVTPAPGAETKETIPEPQGVPEAEPPVEEPEAGALEEPNIPGELMPMTPGAGVEIIEEETGLEIEE